MVARAAIRHCKSIGDEVLSFDRQNLDVADRENVFEILERENPDAVLNCAAYTDVDGSETSIEKCYAANASGVENLALAAKEVDAAFVTISTDYVFDGAKTGFYTQRDTPNPQGVYAKAKYEGEMLARNAYARSIIVRSGWIFGHGGTNFLSVMGKLLAENKKIKAISDSYGTPTFADNLAKRLRELAELDLPAIYHVTNSGAAATFEIFAREVCRLKNFDTDLIEVVSMNDLKRPSPRPVNSPLKCLFSQKFGLSPLQSWEKALAEYLEN